MTLPNQFSSHALLELKLLAHVEATPELNNRQAARILGVSIRLAHVVLKRLVERGHLHVTKYHARRWDYFLTPQGVAEKTRLTVHFVEFSMAFYREARKASANLCRTLAERGQRRVSLLGAGDLAEITYLGVQEWGLSVAAVYGQAPPVAFMQWPVQPLAALAGDGSDAILVCLYDPAQPMAPGYLPAGVARHANMHWIFAPEVAAGVVAG